MASKLTEEERFWAKVDKSGDCWTWTAARRNGYGLFKSQVESLAHRYAYALENGPIPFTGNSHDMCILHKCDNRGCVRASHLFLGSQADNVRDCIQKNRRTYLWKTDRHPSLATPELFQGERNGRAKLTVQQVQEIICRREAGEKRVVLAREYGVVPSTITWITKRITWPLV